MMKSYASLRSPLGLLDIEVLSGRLIRLAFDGEPVDVEAVDWDDEYVLKQTMRQLKEYFAGTRQEFDLPLGPEGTAFQQSVWSALRDIPYGTTCSYADIAGRIGNPKGVRAVGMANGMNPIAIIVPCHRVIGADGSLTGYGGGLERKTWLLTHELKYRSRQAAGAESC